MVPVTSLSADDWLAQGDEALSRGQFEEAVRFYETASEAYDAVEGTKDSKESLLTILSIETNKGTAHSSVGHVDKAVAAYEKALRRFDKDMEKITDDSSRKDAEMIAAQTAFFLGMEYHNSDKPTKAANAYALANNLDPMHWAAVANLGAVLYDVLDKTDEALVAYNQAIDILTQREVEPTDAPAEPAFVLSDLYYRVGLCLSKDPKRKCAMTNDQEKEVSCHELATNSFSKAVELNPDHSLAKHMLATLTADATMTRGSNEYVKKLFDDYAEK